MDISPPHPSTGAVPLERRDVRRRSAQGRHQTIGFVGNCQAELLRRAFAEVLPPSGFTTFYHFFDMTDAECASAQAELSECAVLLMQDIHDVDAYPLRHAIPSDVSVIEFPFLRFASPWPYDDFNGLRDSVARSQDDPALHTTTYYDGVLGKLRRTVPDPQGRFEAYKAHRARGMVDPARVHDFESRRLGALDHRFGFSIGRFILENFRDTQLFYTVNRPCGPVLKMVVDYICEKLDIDSPCAPGELLDELGRIQVPVHPFVAHSLSMSWVDENRLYKHGGRDVTWEGFVRDYIAHYG
jgi:hypothetical protein